MTVFRPSLPPASCTRTRMLRSFSGAGVAANVALTRKEGAKRLKARRPMPLPERFRNSRRVVGRKGVEFFMGGLAELVLRGLEQGDRRTADAAQVLGRVFA